MKKRILSLLLGCVMLLGLLPTMAYAEGSHTHCICGGSVTAGDHTAHSSVNFQPWDGTSAITYKNNVAYVYLTNNATINENLQISGGKTLYLCLKGKNYHSNGTNKIVVKENSRFVLCDCVGTGNIKGVKKGWGGGAVYLYNSRMDFFSGCFGSYVTNFKKGGGAVALDDSNCVLNVYGGSFKEILSNNGGAVYMNGGIMNVYGGTFFFNYGLRNGGAIYMNDGTLNIQGGLFEKNGRNASKLITTDLGGAIYVNKGTLNISGGTFISNGASDGGGAIYMNDGTLNISGNPKIEDNKSGTRVGGYLKEYLNNLFLASGKTLNINGSLSADARIGITTAATAYPVVFTNACNVNYADRFFSDNAELRIAYNNGKKLQLYEPIKYEVTVTGDGHGNVSASPNVAKSETEITLNAAPDTGYHFKEWQVISGGVTVTGNKFIMPEGNVNIRGIFEANTYTVTLNTGGGTIEDGKNVTSYTYGTGATLPTDITRTGYTFKGWHDNEGLAGDPITAIGATETGDKEYWAKWEINQYTVTVKPENGAADITIMQDYGTPITAPVLTREGYQFNGWDKAFPTTMPDEDMTITALWLDNAAPEGEITIGTKRWDAPIGDITFEQFFKDTQMVTITAEDNSGGTVRIEYLLSDRKLSENELAGKTFTAYSEPFAIDPDNEYVIYAKLTDTSGNVAYINTDGIVLDATVPVISGIENGKTYCAGQTVTVIEKYIDTVRVNDMEVSLDGNGQFVLSPASGKQTVVVTDKAGNETTVVVTVNNGHTGGTAACKDKAICEICGESYGELNANNHADMKHIDAKAATKTADGNTEYWYCEDCGKYFADKDGNKEITKADTVTAKLSDDSKSPQTGDNSKLALWVALLLASGAAGILTTIYGRKKKRSVK